MARVEREKYEERMGMKKLPPSKDRIAELEEKTQKMLDRLGPDQVNFRQDFSDLTTQRYLYAHEKNNLG